jgi:hypothetical protein
MTTKSSRPCECGCGNKTNLDPRGDARRYLQGHNRLGQGQGWIDQGSRFISVNGIRRPEHRHLMEMHLGRTLEPHEVVHHVDRNPINNDLTNLVVLDRSEHARLHFAGQKVRRWTTEEQQRAGTLYKAGLRIDEVAVALGRPYVSTQDVLGRQGLTRTTAETKRMRNAA